MSMREAPDRQADPTAAVEAAAIEVPPEIVAQSFGEYIRGWWARVRSGDSGSPAIGTTSACAPCHRHAGTTAIADTSCCYRVSRQA